MPKVGMKNFSYDEAGIKKATAEANKMGLPIEYEDRHYALGGLVTAAISKAGKDLKKASRQGRKSESDMLKKSGKDLKKASKEGKKKKVRGGRQAVRGLNYKANE